MGKKQTTKEQIEGDFEIQEGQLYARSLGPRGNNQHEVEFANKTKKLVTLSSRFRNTIWVKRGSYVIIDPTAGVSEKVAGEIVQVLFLENIKKLKELKNWPKEFDSAMVTNTEHKEDPASDDDLFVNNNRPVMSESESESSDNED